MDKKFKTGQKVKVVRSGLVYDTYKAWAETYGLTNWYCGTADNGDEGVVVVTGKHLFHHDELLGIRKADGSEFIISSAGVELVEDVLPDKFTLMGDLYTWECTKVGNGMYKFVVISGGSIDGQDVGNYHEEDIREWLKDGRYKIVNEVAANGVNCNGEPMSFTVDMLKPFMRAEVGNGNKYIIVPDGKGVGMVREGQLHQTVEFATNDDNAWKIVKVYEAPSQYYSMLNPKVTGSLLWAYKAPKNEFTERLEHLQTHIDSVTGKLKELQAEYDKLKKEANG